MLGTDRHAREGRTGISAIRYLTLVMSIGLLLPGPHNSTWAQAGGIAKISHYEPLKSLMVDAAPKPGVFGQLDVAAVTTVSFEALGRVIVLDLVRNDRLVAKLRSRLPISDDRLTIYKGSIRSVPGSWVRLSIDEERISGVVWDGIELLLIDQLGRLEGLQVAAGDKDRLGVVRLADIELPIDERVHPATAATMLSAEKLLHEAVAGAREFAATEGLTSRAISLGIVIDTALADSISDEVQAAIEWANVVDGIFTEQVDIHLDLEHILNLDGMPDPFTSTNPSALLATLADVKSTNADLAPLGLTHLLTRIDLDGETRGSARLASACGPSEGVSLTEARGSTIDALIMTHEIAHNLGAPHDNEAGSICAAMQGGFIMSPTLNNSSLFSVCSIDQMSAFLNTASCLVAVPFSEIQLEPPALPAQIFYKDKIKLGINIHNIGLESTVDSQFDISGNGAIDIILSGASDRECLNFTWSSQQTCDLDNLYAGETVTVDTEISPQATGQQVLDIVVSAANDTDPTNNVVSLALDVQPAVQVFVDGVNVTDVATRQGGSVTYSVTANNIGDFDTMAILHMQTTPVHTLTSSADCVSPEAGRLDCDIGLLAAGSSQSFEMVVHTDPALGLGITDSLIDSVNVDVTTSIHNTIENPGSQFLLVVFGAAYDMEVGFVELPQNIDQGETKEFVVFLTNLGPDQIADVEFQIRRTSGVQLDFATSDRGNCAPHNEGIGCEFGLFDVEERVNVTVSYTGVDAGNHEVSVMGIPSGGLLLSGVYPTAFAEFDVISTVPPPTVPPTPPATSSGSGGGSTSLLWLIALIATLLWRSASLCKLGIGPRESLPDMHPQAI